MSDEPSSDAASSWGTWKKKATPASRGLKQREPITPAVVTLLASTANPFVALPLNCVDAPFEDLIRTSDAVDGVPPHLDAIEQAIRRALRRLRRHPPNIRSCFHPCALFFTLCQPVCAELFSNGTGT